MMIVGLSEEEGIDIASLHNLMFNIFNVEGPAHDITTGANMR